eukprot:gnl/TRDRNA2_/TRDRNA2_30342_c0_seq1.p1 gnl/TRDRNA2_/TRDRNA2_30342_c0~~gnl/TRDRNA2_/TRDRNA2_30342_c0_seq1.p1  ORF type:complete len:330 (-),score=59.68 gnl/TRDRNA2_/TRDRNA2_30342_c0_seq1:156-1109(-)
MFHNPQDLRTSTGPPPATRYSLALAAAQPRVLAGMHSAGRFVRYPRGLPSAICLGVPRQRSSRQFPELMVHTYPVHVGWSGVPALREQQLQRQAPEVRQETRSQQVGQQMQQQLQPQPSEPQAGSQQMHEMARTHRQRLERMRTQQDSQQMQMREQFVRQMQRLQRMHRLALARWQDRLVRVQELEEQIHQQQLQLIQLELRELTHLQQEMHELELGQEDLQQGNEAYNWYFQQVLRPFHLRQECYVELMLMLRTVIGSQTPFRELRHGNSTLGKTDVGYGLQALVFMLTRLGDRYTAEGIMRKVMSYVPLEATKCA